MWGIKETTVIYSFSLRDNTLACYHFFQSCFEACFVLQKPTFKVIEESRWKNGNKKKGCYYLFELNHKDACSPKPASKLGGGAIFIIM